MQNLPRIPENPRRILVCQQNQIGDVLLSTPCLRLLQERFPGAALHVLTEKKCVPVLENNPRIAKIWVIDRDRGLLGMLALLWAISRERFDIAIDFQQLIRLRLAVLVSGAALRISNKRRWYNRPFYNCYGEEGPGYASKAKSGVLAPLGIAWNGEAPEMYLRPEELDRGREFLVGQGVPAGAPFLTIDATHRCPTRKWPGGHYARLITMLLEGVPDLRLVMLYGPGEKAEVDAIVAQAGTPPRCIVPDRQTSLRELAAIIALARGHIGNCSAPRHFAVAVGTPSLVFHGSNSPGGWTFPSPQHTYLRNEQGEDVCLGCNRSTCARGDLACLQRLTPETVFQRAQEFFFAPHWQDSGGTGADG